jgi:hypothetical protein
MSGMSWTRSTAASPAQTQPLRTVSTRSSLSPSLGWFLQRGLRGEGDWTR